MGRRFESCRAHHSFQERRDTGRVDFGTPGHSELFLRGWGGAPRFQFLGKFRGEHIKTIFVCAGVWHPIGTFFLREQSRGSQIYLPLTFQSLARNSCLG
jgi:hypothetical protein